MVTRLCLVGWTALVACLVASAPGAAQAPVVPNAAREASDSGERVPRGAAASSRHRTARQVAGRHAWRRSSGASSGGGAAGAPTDGTLRLLVYDHNTFHHLAATAAQGLSPLGTQVADTTNFNALLLAGAWDIVIVDCPSTPPAGGWTDLIQYVEAGGRAVVSFWGWGDAVFGDPALPGAFGCALASSISLGGQTLFDVGGSSVFDGVTMPNADWDNHWSVDGYGLPILGGSIPLAHIGQPNQPTIVRGNAGRTVAAMVLDEAGDGWIADGSAGELWRNLIEVVLNGTPKCEPRDGVLGLNASGCECNGKPVVGKVWRPQVSPAPTVGTSTLSTLVVVGLGGPVDGLLAFGQELLVLPPFAVDTGLGQHQIAIADDPVMVGWQGTVQGARIETNAAGGLFVVLLNALDVTSNP